MGARKTSGADLPAMRPALTPEARENQMISLAMDLVEKRIREGTASSAETTHFLKLATSKTMLEKQKLEEENKLLRAKIETLQNAKHSDELYEAAIKAVRRYNGMGRMKSVTSEAVSGCRKGTQMINRRLRSSSRC